jgi:geranylgeranyl pyrophosphate synthase
MKQVERLLRSAVSQVDEPLRSMLSRWPGGGKQLRPALVILTGRLFNAPLLPFRRLAAAVEMLHTATLIHDDLIDRSPLRRGRETLHTIWPTEATVLTGDYLLGEAITLIAKLESPRITEVFAGVLRTMCAGEMRRLLGTQGGQDASDPREASRWREEYYRDIQAKTASLFAATMEMGAVLADAEERQIEMLWRYGQGFGIAFQIMDDVLDFIGEERDLGKPVGSDLRRGLPTLPLLCYLEMTGGSGAVGAVLTGESEEADIQAALKEICASGAIEAALDEARGHAMAAQEALAPFDDSPWVGILHELAKCIIHRDA